MADNPINSNNVKDAKEYLKELLEIRDISRDITETTKESLDVIRRTNKSLKENGDEIIFTSEQLGEILSIYRRINRALNDQVSNAEKVLDNEKGTKDIQKDILKNKEFQRRLLNEEASLSKTLSNLEAERLQAYASNNDEQFDLLSKQIKQAEKLKKAISAQNEELKLQQEVNEQILKISEAADKKVSGFKFFSTFVKSIPGLRAISEPFEKAEKSAREAALASKSGMSVLGAGIKSLASSLTDFLAGPIWITLLIKAAKFFLDAMFEADKRVTNIAKNLVVSKEQASAIYASFREVKSTFNSIFNLTKYINEAYSELINLTDFAVSATNSQIKAQISLTKEIGLSADEALKVQESFAISNIEAEKGLDITRDQIVAFVNQNKLITTGKKVFGDIAKTSKLIQLNFKDNLGSLVKTTLEAKKLGLTLDQVNKIGSSLLNFEQSISAELEAELLTGRDLNLERARLFALNNDIAGLTKEIAAQGITAEKFSRMNRVQQEAIAGALGMGADELADSLYKQKLIDKVAKGTTEDMKKRAKYLRDIGKDTEAIRLEERAAAIEKGILQGKDLKEAEKSVDAQTKFNIALEQAQEIFSDLVVGGYIDRLADSIKGLADSLSEGIWGVITGTGKEKAQSKREAKELDKIISESSKEDQAKINKELDESTSRFNVLAQSLVNMIAQPSELLSSPEERLMRAQAQLKAEYYRENIKPKTEGKIDAKDFTIRTHPKDTLVMAGGTRLNDNSNQETNALLKELVLAVKSGGNIYLDGNKVGTSMNISTYRTQ